MKTENKLQKAIQEKGTLIAAHRGSSAGNIPFNTMEAFEAALYQGADILETDVIISKDGELFIFHTGKEKQHLNQDIRLEEMTGDEIRKLRYVNFDNDLTDYHIPSLDEFLDAFKDRCFINLDHGWPFLPQVIDAVRRHGIEDQVIIKSPGKMEYAKIMEVLAPEMMFMPIYKEKDEMTEQLEQMNINFIGAEVVFAKEDSLLASAEYMEAHHKKGRILWVNSILYYYKAQLSGGHSDDVAMTGNPENGWGWLVDKGFDIVQTDWVLPLKHFIETRKRRS